MKTNPIRKGFTEIHSWIKNFPLTAILFTFIFTFIASLAYDRADLLPELAVVLAVLIVIFAFTMHRQSRKLISLLLILSLVTPTRAQERGPGGTGGGCGVVVGIIVIVGGIGGVLWLRNYCKKKFPKKPPTPTNAPPSDLSFALNNSAVSGDAASFTFSGGSCYDGDPCQEEEGGTGGSGPTIDLTTTFSLTIRIDESEEPGELTCKTISIATQRGPDAYQDWPSLVQEARAMGLTISSQAGDHSFSRNGQPIDPSQSPIHYDPIRQLLATSRSPNCVLYVYRSSDLQLWDQVLVIQTRTGSIQHILDTHSSSQQFYKFWAVPD